MALLVVQDSIWADDYYRDLIVSAFDSCEMTMRSGNKLIFRVEHEEIPTDETIIQPLFVQLVAYVRPFVLDWGLDYE
jgi:hypothetical protein